ncbi:MAG: biotin synthase BioB [Gammaproteobacteria bacterium]|nr:biotin synthase BioB [Gammaproteobacteria bacterium]
MLEDTVYTRIDEITQRVLKGGEMSAEEGVWMMKLDDSYVPWLMAGADRIRKTYRGNEIEVCAISNVRSGNCSENCSFCSQSGHHKTEAPVYNYIPEQTLLEQAERARSWGASDIGIVSKGWGVRSKKEREQLKSYLGTLKDKSDIGRCASLGVLDRDTAEMLKESGLENYHHNLECAESFFDEVCTTHTYQENIDTIKHAVDAGLRVCAGGILGMGETIEQRVELADTLRKLGVESVPMNFLNPAKGTPFADRQPLKPYEILRAIATYRYLLPKAEIRIAGGRGFLGDMQSMIFMAGASGVMIGDYLTTQGRSVHDDLKMIDDLKLDVRGDTQQRRDRTAALASTSVPAQPINFVN